MNATVRLAVLSIVMAIQAVAAEKVFQEKGGLIVIQAESGPLIPPWVNGTSKLGYTGSSYRTWAGADVTKWPSSSEDFPYVFKFNVTKPGRYNFRVHNWVIQAYASFFAQLDGAPTHYHYFSHKDVKKWNWTTWVDTNAEHKPAYFDLDAGVHTLALKGRTGNSGYLIDRFHLYLNSVSNPLSLSLPESLSADGGGSPPPPPPLPPTPPAPAPPPTPSHPPGPHPHETTVNDDNALVRYGGTWTDIAYPGRINGDEHYTKNAGASAQFMFTGTEIVWVATKYSNRGKADVYIDGTFSVTVDQYSPVVLYQQKVFENTSLSPGPHTIKIVCKGAKNPASTGNFIDVDAFLFQ